jgi:ABC-type transport system involved in multi-copper enzyme maturation permease subunit
MAKNKNIPSAPPTHFNVTARLLHWLMASMILTMIFVGLGMMTSLTWRPWLLNLHIPLGIAILLLVIIRLINRLSFSVPKMPASVSGFQSKAAGRTPLAPVWYDGGFATNRMGTIVCRRVFDKDRSWCQSSPNTSRESIFICFDA